MPYREVVHQILSDAVERFGHPSEWSHGTVRDIINGGVSKLFGDKPTKEILSFLSDLLDEIPDLDKHMRQSDNATKLAATSMRDQLLVLAQTILRDHCEVNQDALSDDPLFPPCPYCHERRLRMGVTPVNNHSLYTLHCRACSASGPAMTTCSLAWERIRDITWAIHYEGPNTCK